MHSACDPSRASSCVGGGGSHTSLTPSSTTSHPTGLRAHREYGALWASLTGRPLVHPGEHGNFVAHGMTFYRPYVREMLLEFSPRVRRGRQFQTQAENGDANANSTNGTRLRVAGSYMTPDQDSLVDSGAWVEHAFGSICDQFLSQGFSEYWYYSSWVLQRHPRNAVVRVAAAGCEECAVSSRPAMFDRAPGARCELMAAIRSAPEKTSAGYVVLENHASEHDQGDSR